MYRKNTAGQFVCFQMLLTATGAVATGLSPTARRCIDGTFAAGGGTVTEDSAGFYKYAMAQADTNGNDISLAFSAATAMPVCINFVTTAADPTAASNFGITNLDATTTSRMASYTQPTGFLAATFPGTVASPTNITAGTITTVSSVTGLTASNLDTTVSSRLSTAGYTAPDNTSVTAIKAKTDSLTFSVANKVDSNIKSVNNVTVTGDGAGTPWGP